MPSDVYRKYLPPVIVILTQMTLTRKQSNISLLRQLPGLSSLPSPYIAIPVFQPFPCTLTLSGHSLCYFTHHACHLHSTEPCLKILPLVHFRGKWPPRSLACCLQSTIECLKLPSACLHFPIIWLVTRGHYQPEALHRTMDSWCHLVVGFQVLPCVPPFNLGCHNQTGRKREDVFLASVVETLADSKLLQVCQIDAFSCSDTHIFLQIKQEHLLFSLPTNYSTVHLSFHLLQQWPVNLSYQGPCGYLRACRRPLDLSLICSSHVRTSQYHPIQGVVVP